MDLERLVVRLTADAGQYMKTMDAVERRMFQFAKTVQGGIAKAFQTNFMDIRAWANRTFRTEEFASAFGKVSKEFGRQFQKEFSSIQAGFRNLVADMASNGLRRLHEYLFNPPSLRMLGPVRSGGGSSGGSSISGALALFGAGAGLARQTGGWAWVGGGSGGGGGGSGGLAPINQLARFGGVGRIPAGFEWRDNRLVPKVEILGFRANNWPGQGMLPPGRLAIGSGGGGQLALPPHIPWFANWKATSGTNQGPFTGNLGQFQQYANVSGIGNLMSRYPIQARSAGPGFGGMLGTAGGIVGGGLGMAATGIGKAFSLLTSPSAILGMGVFGFTLEKLVSSVIKSAAKFEQTAIALEVMTGSKQVGSRMLQQIIDLAVETPFRSRELIAGAKQLKGFGISNEDVLPSLKVLGDVSAGTGTSLDRIILAFGQVRSAGRLMGTEMRQFVNAGIPMIDYLSKVMQVPTENIKKLVENGAVSYEHVKRAFNLMVSQGGPYFMLMDRLSQTVAGRWEAFTENLEVFGRNIGLSFFRGFGLAGLLNEFSQITRSLSEGTSWLDQWFVKLRKIFDVGRTVAEILGGKFMEGLKEVSGGLTQRFSFGDVEEGLIRAGEYLLDAFQGMVAASKEIASVLIRGVVLPLVQFGKFTAKLTGSEDSELDQAFRALVMPASVWSQIMDKAQGKGGTTAVERELALQASQMAEDARQYRAGEVEPWAIGLRGRHVAIVAARNAANLKAGLQSTDGQAVAAALNPSMSLGFGIANALSGKAPAQIAEAFMPPFFMKDKSRFPGSVAGGANNDFQNTLRQIDEARRFLFKKEVGIGGLAGGFGIGGTQWAFQQMANAEFLDAFDKLEKSVNINTKTQNAGSAAMKGSQEAIAIIARSEAGGKEDMGARVERVMNAVKAEVEKDAKNSGEMRDALNKWLEKNPGVISREP